MADGEGGDRNAAINARFERLPDAGTTAYWAALADAEPATRAPLEVLAMCVRERFAAGQRQDAARAYELLLPKAENTLWRWVRQFTPRNAPDREGIIEEIMQDCATDLWQELAGDGPTFLTEGFWHKLELMTHNRVNQKLIEEGLRTRPGVRRPTRVPHARRDRLDLPASPDDPHALAERVADPQAEDPYSLIALLSDIRALLAGLSSDERILLQNELTGELTQKQLGAQMGVSDRTIRTWLTVLQARLHALYDPPGTSDQPGDSGGGAAGGEEGHP